MDRGKKGKLVEEAAMSRREEEKTEKRGPLINATPATPQEKKRRKEGRKEKGNKKSCLWIEGV